MLKNISLLISSFLFSLLFFQKQIGLNYLLFAVLATLLLIVFNFNKFKDKNIWFFAASFLVSSLMVFIYHSSLALISSVIAFLILLGALTEIKSSLYVKLINGFYSAIAAGFTHYYNQLTNESIKVKKRDINYLYWLKMIGIPTIVILVFTILYRSANPYFDELLRKIDFSFINLQWILFTLMAYFLLLNIISPLAIQPTTKLDLETGNLLKKDQIKKQSITTIIQENQLGIVLLVLLNLLILFYLVTDIIYLSNIKGVNASGLSKTVHEGIYALIISIVFAIIIILYFFRGSLNFYKKNKPLKTLTVFWIALNTILILVTAYKNQLYVSHYGFTYKRIGVFVYLILTLIGLVSTYIKINAKYNLWYLCRKNLSIGFVILIMSSLINWDLLITHYNTKMAKNIDVKYLINLSDNNTFLLMDYYQKHTLDFEIQRKIDIKHEQYLTKLKGNSWQELIYDNLKNNPKYAYENN